LSIDLSFQIYHPNCFYNAAFMCSLISHSSGRAPPNNHPKDSGFKYRLNLLIIPLNRVAYSLAQPSPMTSTEVETAIKLIFIHNIVQLKAPSPLSVQSVLYLSFNLVPLESIPPPPPPHPMTYNTSKEHHNASYDDDEQCYDFSDSEDDLYSCR